MRGLEVEYKFVKPPGYQVLPIQKHKFKCKLKYNTMYLPLFYQFKLGTKERDGEFVVHLTLAGDSVNQVT